ncbi:MAG: sulfatase-like hydrolase/transferase, partial [Verrucomicrobiota bacterium]
MTRLAALLVCLFVLTIAGASERPNILFIAIDDLNDWLGCYGGHPQVITPNIDRLAEKGILFSNAHCAAPVCKSSRTAIFTGLHPVQTGVYGNRDPNVEKLFPGTIFLTQVFEDAGYDVAGTGKMLHGDARTIFSESFR